MYFLTINSKNYIIIFFIYCWFTILLELVISPLTVFWIYLLSSSGNFLVSLLFTSCGLKSSFRSWLLCLYFGFCICLSKVLMTSFMKVTFMSISMVMLVTYLGVVEMMHPKRIKLENLKNFGNDCRIHLCMLSFFS